MIVNPLMLEQDKFFHVTACETHNIAGYYIISAKNAVSSIAEMPLPQVQQLGITIQSVQQRIYEEVRPEKIYCLSFCEVLATFHMHLFPRTKQLLQEYRADRQILENTDVNGALLFDWARNKYRI